MKMRSNELRTYLRAAARELTDLGLLERRRLLRAIRSDVMELAAQGAAEPPSEDDVARAVATMPSPPEAAERYLTPSPPPVIPIRLSLAMNVILSLSAVVFSGILFAILTGIPYWLSGVGLLISLAVILLLLAGTAGSALYGLALIVPERAAPWRFSVVPAAGVCAFFDGFMAMVFLFLWGLPWTISIGTFLGITLGGAYTISYAHKQLPRLVEGSVLKTPGGDYFAVLSRKLGALDLVRRHRILAELRQHVREADLTNLDPKRQRRTTEDVLGPPAEVASAHLREAEPSLGPRSRVALKGALGLAAVGMIVGIVLLALGLSASTFWGYLTPLGLVGSAGLFVMGAALSSAALSVFKAPAKAADLDVPIGAFALAIALLVSGVVAAAPFGGLVGQWDARSYDVLASVPREDGGLAVFWAAYGDALLFGPQRDSPPVEAGVTQLDAGRNIVAIESLPGGTSGAPLLDARQENDTWFALFSDSLHMWGGFSRNAGLTPPSGWHAVDGRLDGRLVRVAWAGHMAQAGILQIDFEGFEAPFRRTDDLRWSRTFPLGPVENVRVAVGENAVLVAAELDERAENYTRSALSVHLLDYGGDPIRIANLVERNVTWTGPGDMANGTALYVDGLHATNESFWLLGHSWTGTGGTTVFESWAVHIDARTGASAEQELQRMEAPRPSFPPKPGDRQVLPFHSSIASDGHVFAASSLLGQTANASGGWEPDPGTGGLYLTSLRSGGEMEYTVRLGDAYLGPIPLFPFLATWKGRVTVFASPMGSFGSAIAYSLVPPSTNATSDEIPLDFGQGALLHSIAARELSGGLGSGPEVTDFAGEAYMEDPGLLGWRRHTISPSLAFVRMPAILQIDLTEGTTRTIPLTSPHAPPDILLEILTTTVLTMTGVLSVVIGYPRWRLSQSRKSG